MAKMEFYMISIMHVMWNLGSVRLTIQLQEYINGASQTQFAVLPVDIPAAQNSI